MKKSRKLLESIENMMRFLHMRRLSVILYTVLMVPLMASEKLELKSWPLWDGIETVDQYAARVNLPSTKTYDLGNNISLETVLIPAGMCTIGTPNAVPPNETVRFGQAILIVATVAFILALLPTLNRSLRQGVRFQFH